MSTTVRRFFVEDDGVGARQDGNALSWGWLGLVTLLVAAVLFAAAVSHPDVSAGTPEPPDVGLGD